MPNIERLMEKLGCARGLVPLREIEQVLRAHLYLLERISGSHFHYEGPGGRFVSFPTHNNKVKACYVKAIIKKIGNYEKN